MRQALVPRRQPAAPFLKWAGGKTQLLSELDVHIPEFDRYYEPFLGGGALFFHLASEGREFRAHLSDLNSDLVNAFNVVKTDVEDLVAVLRRHESAYHVNPEVFYYGLRSRQPRGRLARAGRLIALNKTCYNGLFRVNSSGRFNVPIGNYKNPSICNESQLRNASAALRRTMATITAGSYKDALSKASAGDFVYLDPPFIPLSRTSNFVSYTQGGFTPEDQKQLALLYRRLDRKGCKVLLSNSDTVLARELYSDFEQFRIRASRAISCKGEGRTGFTELLVRNYSL